MPRHGGGMGGARSGGGGRNMGGGGRNGHLTRNLLLAGAAGAVVGASMGGGGGGGGGRGRSDSDYEGHAESSSYADDTSNYNDGPDPKKILKIVCILSLFTLVLCLFFFPYEYSETIFMLPGESAEVRSPQGKWVDTTWHSSMYIESNVTEKGRDLAYFFEDCPKSATNYRYRNYSHNFHTTGIYYYDTFYLNPGSSVLLSWNTSVKCYFDIYRGNRDFERENDPLYSTRLASLGGKDIFFNDIEYSDLYYFVWRLQDYLSILTGGVSYDFNLTVYNTSTAQPPCDLTIPCEFQFKRGQHSCVVVDISDTTDDTMYWHKAKVKPRAGFFYSMFFVVPVGFYIVAGVIIYFVQKSMATGGYSEFDALDEGEAAASKPSSPPADTPMYQAPPPGYPSAGYPPQAYVPQGYQQQATAYGQPPQSLGQPAAYYPYPPPASAGAPPPGYAYYPAPPPQN